jgi:hypothetical protein
MLEIEQDPISGTTNIQTRAKPISNDLKQLEALIQSTQRTPSQINDEYV